MIPLNPLPKHPRFTEALPEPETLVLGFIAIVAKACFEVAASVPVAAPEAPGTASPPVATHIPPPAAVFAPLSTFSEMAGSANPALAILDSWAVGESIE
jgi:hypothetical protein